MRFRFPLILLLSVLIWALAGCNRSGDSDSAENSSADSTLVAENQDDESSRKENDSKGDSDDEGDDDDDAEDDPVPVDVVVLARGPIESVIRASASLEAEKQVMVMSESVGRVRELLVEEGDVVSKGALLVRLQDDEQQISLARAESNLAKAKRELDRQQRLREEDLSSDQSLNDAEYAFEQETIALKDARRRLDYTRVRATIAGTVTARRVNLGDQVQVGQELFEIIDFKSLVARIYVPEKNLGEIAPGQRARVVAKALSPDAFDAEVLRISPVVDPRTGTVKATVAVGSQPGLRPGLFTDVELVTRTHENAILIPKRALVYDNDQTFVFRIGGEREVERVLVHAALSNRFFIEPSGGVAVGDSVVVAGQTGLKAGVKVRLVGEETDSKAEGDTASTEVNGKNEAP